MERIEDCLVFLLGKAYQHATQMAKQRLAPYGVTPVQYAALRLLWEHDGQSGTALGERLRLDSATITGLLDRLNKAGLIERRPDQRDRRAQHIFLTVQGRALEGSLDREMDALNAELLDQLPPADAERLLTLLTLFARVKAP
jgi:DNA-binding MarR family transcriptional regulator